MRSNIFYALMIILLLTGIEGYGNTNKDSTIQILRQLNEAYKTGEFDGPMASLIHHTETVLNKPNTDKMFTYRVETQPDTKWFISDYQFSGLKAILNKYMTNTIEHAQFDNIQASFAQHGNQWSLTYRHNGKGWNTRNDTTGIGIQNIKERIQQLNGDFLQINQYPNGYHINISLQLR